MNPISRRLVPGSFAFSSHPEREKLTQRDQSPEPGETSQVPTSLALHTLSLRAEGYWCHTSTQEANTAYLICKCKHRACAQLATSCRFALLYPRPTPEPSWSPDRWVPAGPAPLPGL